MKVVYSYHGGVPNEFLLKMAELSFLSVRNYTEYPIELWVDEENKKYFRMPYDSVVESDFGFPRDGYWNMSKLYVYAQQTEPFLHIDFDTCVMPGFTIPEGDIVCEKIRTIELDEEYTKYALKGERYNDIICSGFLGGNNYGDLFNEQYKWAISRIEGKPTYKHLISLEEISFTQRINIFEKRIDTLNSDTFLHFWCRSEYSKEKVYGSVVDSLLEFNRNAKNGLII